MTSLFLSIFVDVSFLPPPPPSPPFPEGGVVVAMMLPSREWSGFPDCGDLTTL